VPEVHELKVRRDRMALGSRNHGTPPTNCFHSVIAITVASRDPEGDSRKRTVCHFAKTIHHRGPDSTRILGTFPPGAILTDLDPDDSEDGFDGGDRYFKESPCRKDSARIRAGTAP
jgi:hypothetical protein